MKNQFDRLTTGLSRILAVLLVVILAGCQQSQCRKASPSGQKQAAGISRRDRLVANENLGLKNELAQCRSEVENQKNLVEQCRRENDKVSQQSDKTTKWLMDELPRDLLNDAARLSQENTKLTAKIIELEEALRQCGQQEQSSLTPSPNEPPAN